MAENIGMPSLNLRRGLRRLRESKIITTSRRDIEVIDWPALYLTIAVQIC